MAMTQRQRLGVIAYASLFCIVLPVTLWAWARETGGRVHLPAYGDSRFGLLLAAGGFALMAAGMLSLWRRGGGLPMNALPPPKLVTSGIYHWVSHPIYLGFSVFVFGLAMAWQSPGGLWMVGPAVALGSAALVFGYERPDLERRFGAAARDYRWLPEDSLRSPAGMARIRCYLFVLLPWVAAYEIIVWSGSPKDGFTLALPGEAQWPILPWTEPLYMSTYFVVGLTPLLVRTSRSLRQFMIRAWMAMVISFLLYLALPVVAPLKDLTPSGFWSHVLAFERKADPPLAAFPSFHTIWAVLAADMLRLRSRRFGWVWWLWAAGVAFSCVATGQHWVADVAAGLVLSVALLRIGRVWNALRGVSEWLANSWREWRIGPVRVINHALYGGMAAGVAVFIVGTLLGPGHLSELLLTALCGLVGAALWAQWVEGSRRLLRPYGYFGGLLAVTLACMAAPLFGADAMLLLAAYCVAAPWMQAIGRLRCLVQGCCHGRPAAEHVGIRYRHPSSRVSQIPALAELPLHATPLYSILWNVVTGIALARMWWASCDLHIIAGVFAILNGYGRFVEEAYRGEPQTPLFAGLRVYQWLAVAMVILGGVVTSSGGFTPAPAPVLNLESALLAVCLGLVSAVALGVDFPASNRRFARLA